MGEKRTRSSGKMRAADVVLLADGCERECGKHVLARCGVEDYRYVRVTELGIEKGKPKRGEEDPIAPLQRRLETCL